MDNWSLCNLAYDSHSVYKGELETSFPPRNMPEKRRGFALRAYGIEGRRAGTETKGTVAWTLTKAKDNVKMSHLTIGWKLDQRDGHSKFALGLGDIVPAFADLWDTREAGRLVSRSTNRLNHWIKLSDGHVTVAAKATRSEEAPFHYKLHLTVVPQKMDVFSWVKYFKEDKEDAAHQAKRSQNVRHGGQRHQNALPKVTVKEKEDKVDDGRPLYERKDLLRPGPVLMKLQEEGIEDLRSALRREAKEHSVAVGIHLENWSRFRLSYPKVELKIGKLLSTELTPGFVDPGRQEVSIVGNDGTLTGTSGVARWTLGSETGRVLSIMWSVPYNHQIYNTWVAVGLSSVTNQPTYGQMYKEKDPARFVRHKAGRDFEFSDGSFIVKVFMDGGASSKPVLHVGLVPIDEADLASDIRKKLGMPIVKIDDVKHRREDDTLPQVQKSTTAAAGKMGSVHVLVAAMVMMHLWTC